MNVLYCNQTGKPIYNGVEHAHPVWEIILRLTGEADFHVGSKTYHTIPGDILLIPPHTNHLNNSALPFTDIYVMIDNLDFTDSLLTHDENNQVLSLMNLLYDCITEQKNNHQSIANCLGETIVQYIKRYLSSNYKYPFVEELKNVIYQNISNSNFNLAEAIKSTGYHVDYLRKCFTEEIGSSPSKYLTLLRINQARGILLNGYSVEEAAFLCGYHDSFYFSKVFKKHTGLSPQEFKHQKIQDL